MSGMRKELPSPELMRQMLRYEPDTGKLFWLPRPRDMFPKDRSCATWNTRFSGREALTSNSWGYKLGRVLGTITLAHRAAWCLHHGYWPTQVDHINLDKADNRIVNLREANHSQNGSNILAPSHNTSGVKGVSLHKPNGKWQANIRFMRKRIYLGSFETKQLPTLMPKHQRSTTASLVEQTNF